MVPASIARGMSVSSLTVVPAHAVCLLSYVTLIFHEQYHACMLCSNAHALQVLRDALHCHTSCFADASAALTFLTDFALHTNGASN